MSQYIRPDTCSSPLEIMDITVPNRYIYYWDFGDGILDLENPNHQFSECGTYTVTLEVTDENNCSNFYQKYYSIRSS